MTIKRFEDVIAWQKARALNKKLFEEFSGLRNFTFKDQILRASLSITNNIAEGFERSTDKELKYFLHIARGSTAEVRSMLYTAFDIGYVSEGLYKELMVATNEIGRLLTAFIKTLGQKPNFEYSHALGRLSDDTTMGR